jgi:type I restriction enzyme S subunit
MRPEGSSQSSFRGEDIPRGWSWTTLRRAVTHYSGGSSILKLEYSHDGIPVLTKGDVKQFGRISHSGRFVSPEIARRRRYQTTRPGDFLLTTRDLTQEANFLGLIAPVPESQEFIVNQGANLVRLSSDVYGRFVVYWCNGPTYRSYIKTHYVGSTQIHLRKDDFLDAPLLLPPLPEQRAIAEVLGSLDDKVDTNNRCAGVLDALAEALFKELLDDRGEHRHEMNLSQVATVVLGGTPDRKRPEFWTSGTIPWINSGKANNFRVLEPSELITEDALAKSAAKVMPRGATVIAITGATLGQVSRLEIDTSGNQSLVGVWATDRKLNDWLYFCIRSRRADLTKHATGGAQQHINKRVVEDLPVEIPDVQALTIWHSVVEPLLDSTAVMLKENLRLTYMRDTLLPLLVSGKLRVRDAESLVGNAV